MSNNKKPKMFTFDSICVTIAYMEMPVPVQEDTQSQALVILQSYVLQEYGEEKASPVKLLAQIAWDESNKMADRLRAAIALLPYCHTPFKATDFIGPDTGPDWVINVLGTVNVTPPVSQDVQAVKDINGEAATDTQ